MIEVSFQQKIKGKIIEYRISLYIIFPILGAICWLIKKSYFFHLEVFQIWLKNHIPLLVFAITLIIILLLISFVYICFLKNKIKIFKTQTKQLKQELENKPFLDSGVFWDTKLNPYCPVCEKPLSRIAEFEQKYHSDAYCYNCNEHIPISDDEGQLTISEAQKKLREKHKINHNR